MSTSPNAATRPAQSPKSPKKAGEVPTISSVAHQRNFFNLADEPWIEVIRSGSIEFVSLCELFSDALHIDSIGHADPLERIAFWRFLIALTHLYNHRDENLKQRLSSKEGFDPSVVERMFAELSDRLWLIHPTAPFAQNLTSTVLEPESTVTIKDLGALLLDVPGDSTKAWFSRPVDAPVSLSPQEAAAAVLTRWFCGPSGNTSRIESASLGTLKRTEGGRSFWSIRGLTQMFRTGENLFLTLVGNLTPVSGSRVALFDTDWMGPHGAQTVLRETLLASTVTGCGTLLIDDGSNEFSNVVVSSTPVIPDVAKALMVRDDVKKSQAGWRDPHLGIVRTTSAKKNGTSVVEDYRVMVPPMRSFNFLHRFCEKAATPDGLDLFGVFATQNLMYGATAAQATESLELIVSEMGGATTSPIIKSLSLNDLPAHLFVTDPATSEAVHAALGFIYGSKSVTSVLRFAVRKALRDENKPTVGDLMAKQAEEELLNGIDEISSNVVELIIANGSQLSDAELIEFRRELARATVNAFDSVTSTFTSPTYSSSIAQARTDLYRLFPKEQNT